MILIDFFPSKYIEQVSYEKTMNKLQLKHHYLIKISHLNPSKMLRLKNLTEQIKDLKDNEAYQQFVMYFIGSKYHDLLLGDVIRSFNKVKKFSVEFNKKEKQYIITIEHCYDHNIDELICKLENSKWKVMSAKILETR